MKNRFMSYDSWVWRDLHVGIRKSGCKHLSSLLNSLTWWSRLIVKCLIIFIHWLQNFIAKHSRFINIKLFQLFPLFFRNNIWKSKRRMRSRWNRFKFEKKRGGVEKFSAPSKIPSSFHFQLRTNYGIQNYKHFPMPNSLRRWRQYDWMWN